MENVDGKAIGKEELHPNYFKIFILHKWFFFYLYCLGQVHERVSSFNFVYNFQCKSEVWSLSINGNAIEN